MATYLNSLSYVNDVEKKYDFTSRNPSESEAYEIFHDFVNLYASPRLAHVLIMRNHVVPTAVTICDIQGTEAWSSWSGMMFYRSGVTLCSNTSNDFLIFSNFLFNDRDSVQNKQGFILHVDRLIMPDLSGTPLKQSHHVTITPSPTISQHSSFNVIVPGSESNGARPSMIITSSTPTPTPDPSIPVYSNAAKPFPSSSPRVTDVSGPPTSAPDGDDEVACFPASATLSVARTKRRSFPTTNSGKYQYTDQATVRMSEVRVGMCVHTLDEDCSRIFVLSHQYRLDDIKFPFLRIRTTCNRFSITLSRGHYIYILPHNNNNNDGSTMIAVSAEAVRPGDRIVTTDGIRIVDSVDVVYEYGLFAPHSTDGRLFVDGVLASCYTRATGSGVNVPHALLAPVRMAVKVKRTASMMWMYAADVMRMNGRKKRRRKGGLYYYYYGSSFRNDNNTVNEYVDDDDDDDVRQWSGVVEYEVVDERERERERGEGVFDTLRGIVLFSKRFLKIIK